MKPITKKAAIEWLSKALDSRFNYRENKAALLAPDRPTRADIEAIEAVNSSTHQAMHERSKIVLAADPEYQQLRAAHKMAGDALSKVKQQAYLRRITVGRTNAFAFMVDAEGDTWDEVIAKVKKDLAKDAT